MENKPDRIIWHHTGDSQSAPQFDKVNAYHKTRWNYRSGLGFYGGYHVLIEKDGTARRYRDDEEIGAHDFNENVNTIGIALAGNFDVERPTDPQRYAFAALLRQTLARWSIPPERIEPHRLRDTTSCPGRLIPDGWPQAILLLYPAQSPDDVLRDIIRFIEAKLHAPR